MFAGIGLHRNEQCFCDRIKANRSLRCVVVTLERAAINNETRRNYNPPNQTILRWGVLIRWFGVLEGSIIFVNLGGLFCRNQNLMFAIMVEMVDIVI